MEPATMEIQEAYTSFFQKYERLRTLDNENSSQELLLQLTDQVKLFRNSCAKGQDYQNLLTTLPQFFDVLNTILSKNTFLDKFSLDSVLGLKKMTWQLIANICVQNNSTQTIVWELLGESILALLEDITPFTDIQLMTVYNIFRGAGIQDHRRIFQMLVKICGQPLEQGDEQINLEFFHIFFEYFLTEYPRGVTLYGPLGDLDRITVLQYISSYIYCGSKNGPVTKSLMDYISKEFKKKSDCVLKTVESYVDSIHPREVIALLDVISKASGEEVYTGLYCEDHSLFLNVGSLLEALNKIGKKSTNVFTPMQKLEQVAPASKINTDFEKEISFEMKTMLVRTSANLLYRNRTNQDYARETGIIMAIMDCTSADARNPLIKEWSILAIRNLCEGCPENQEFISGMCKVGEAPNDLLAELSMELGSLRIRSNA